MTVTAVVMVENARWVLIITLDGFQTAIARISSRRITRGNERGYYDFGLCARRERAIDCYDI